ncbi:hypothetical protein [Curtobacterium sp. VKM Ac-2884]|uniref:hypothetical protein n=1 Tax=Curtobacterium sp. VKM Ac-2884 TaxID=2783818 RepID=UPI00188BADFD|nr:hypothetical protein [Curtobacterium sp. VKM Ac-2884]MBF4602794.1 hypothetical protein [Curtobacterium sp. VKM Ac-2884]
MNASPTLEKVSFSVPNLAALVDVSEDTIRKAIESGALTARYPTEAGRKPIILREDAVEWLQNLPTEKPTAA